MEKSGTERVYPAAPLEVSNGAAHSEQHEALLPPAPPTYAQATGVTPATTAPAGAAPQGSASHVVVITPGPTVNYGPHPIDMQCPYCHNYMRTRLSFRPTSRTHLMALLLCLFQLYCCICLPYCIGSCMNTCHYCGLCNHYLGDYVRA